MLRQGLRRKPALGGWPQGIRLFEILIMTETMKTIIEKIDINADFASHPAVLKAAEVLRSGELVAFPTETVYGLGGNALLADSARRIYAAKGRPSDNPLIVHVAELAQVSEFAELNERAVRVLERFAPGPITVVLPKKPCIPKEVTGGLETVAVRIPSHPVAQAMLKAAAIPVAAPSANISGKPSPTDGAHVAHDLNGRIAMIIDCGASGVGLESTVLDLTVEPAVILRPGAVTLEDLQEILPDVVLGGTKTLSGAEAPKAPGMKYRHYAPSGKVEIYDEAELIAAYQAAADPEIVILGSSSVLEACQPKYGFELAFDACDVVTAANRLFAGLRYCDEIGAKRIMAQSFAAEGLGVAYMNRLNKAAVE